MIKSVIYDQNKENEFKIVDYLYFNKITDEINLDNIQRKLQIENVNEKEIELLPKYSFGGVFIYSKNYVILGYNRYKKVYEDFSGRKDVYHDNIENIAISELFEETSGTILLADISKLDYINIPITSNKRIISYCRLYLLEIEDNIIPTLITLFKSNRKIASKFNYKYKEMSKIIKIKKDKFFSVLKNNNDIKYNINPRLKLSLNLGFENKIK